MKPGKIPALTLFSICLAVILSLMLPNTLTQMFIYTLGHQENNVRVGMFLCLILFSMSIDSETNELRWTAKFTENGPQSSLLYGIECFGQIDEKPDKELHDVQCISPGIDKQKKLYLLYYVIYVYRVSH